MASDDIADRVQHFIEDELLKLTMRSADGSLVPLSELVRVSRSERERPRYRKDLMPVVYVVADQAGRTDSPLYGLFAMRSALRAIQVPGGGTLGEYFISPPEDPQREFAI